MFWFRLQYKEMSDVPATMKLGFHYNQGKRFLCRHAYRRERSIPTREILSRNNGTNSALPITKFHQARFNAFFETFEKNSFASFRATHCFPIVEKNMFNLV